MPKDYLFKKGQSGNPGGVPKNPKNPKRKARLKVQEILQMLDFKPFEEMVKIYRDPNTKTRYKVEILIDLCNYIAPKLKSVEFTSDNENPFVINLNLQPGKKRLEFTPTQDESSEEDDD
jgi:hypothetical protein